LAKRNLDFEVYLIYVDEERCDGCDDCVTLCPGGVFVVHHKAKVVRPESCLGCRTCEAVCKSAAVIITEI